MQKQVIHAAVSDCQPVPPTIQQKTFNYSLSSLLLLARDETHLVRSLKLPSPAWDTRCIHIGPLDNGVSPAMSPTNDSRLWTAIKNFQKRKKTKNADQSGN